MLQREIADSNLSAAQQRRFRRMIVDVVIDNGRIGTMESQYVQHLFMTLDNPGGDDIADVESLWQHSELVLKTAITVSVLSGRYPIEQARRVSRLAQQFGLSAKKLRALEDQALRAIQFRGRQMNIDATKTLTESLQQEATTSAGEASYSDFMQGLWQSDADLIQHTQHTDLDWDDSAE